MRLTRLVDPPNNPPIINEIKIVKFLHNPESDCNWRSFSLCQKPDKKSANN
jgi:hypothetical protein